MIYNLETGTYNCGVPKADIHSYLLEYIGKCQSGEILVGSDLKQEFDILIENLNNPDIKFDVSDAQKRIKFIESKCKFYEAPFAGKPFLLQLFQKAIIEAIYSFKIYDEEVGRYVRLYRQYTLLIGRKNGKTPLEGAINLSEFFCGPVGTKIICASNDYDQADIMFSAINSMREESPSLERRTRKNLKGIYFGNPKKVKKHGKFSYENKGCIRKLSAKTGAKEGRNILKGSADEVHEMKDNTLIMPIIQALSTQDEPLFGEISTEGFVNGGYLDGRLIEGRKVLNKELSRPRWLIWLYTQDSEEEVWQNEKSWVKSNPGVGTIKKWSFLREMIEESRTNMKTRAFVLAKDFNIKQNNSSAWLSEDVYNYDCEFNIKNLRGAFGIGAVDLSETTDLTSARMTVMLPGDNHKYMISMYFIPESKLDVKDDDGLSYRELVKQGFITVCPGNDNDFSFITKFFIKCVKEYGICPYKIGYDNALAKYWVKEMEDIFGEEIMERVPQRREVLSSPMNLLEADLRSRIINYNNNQLDKRCLKNTAMDMDKRGLIMPIKINGQAQKHIDGTVTMIITEAIFQEYKSEYLKYVGVK